MNILVFGKYPPIQGGTSNQVMSTARHLAAAGHTVHVVTNAGDAVVGSRCLFTAEDEQRMRELHTVDGPGQVTVHSTSELGPTSYTPWADPFASKMFGIGIDLATDIDFDVVIGWYLEPYGLVAGLIAGAVGRPLVLRHAGSDLARLSRHPDLRRAYRWLIPRADAVLTGKRSRPTLLDLGADPSHLVDVGPGAVPDYFAAPAGRLAFDELTGPAIEAFRQMGLPADVVDALVGAVETGLPAGTPTIGMCGKVAGSKGSYDLLESLSVLADEGVPFGLLGAVGGPPQLHVPFLEALSETGALRGRFVVLPPLAPWRMPAFFDTCDLVCLLERRFDVGLHRSRVPEEVLRRGRALVLSEELRGRLGYGRRLRPEREYLSVTDPADRQELTAVLRRGLTSPELVQAVGDGGQRLALSLPGRAVDGPTSAVLRFLKGTAAPTITQ